MAILVVLVLAVVDLIMIEALQKDPLFHIHFP